MSQLNREFKTNKKQQIDYYSISAIYILIAATALAVYMIWHYYGYGQWTMDGTMQSFMRSVRTPWLDEIFRGITATGETLPVVCVTLLIVMTLALKKKTKEAVLVALYMLAAWRLNDFLKELIQRPRPALSMHLVETSGYSLPSGHSMNFMALVLLSLYFIWIFSNHKKLKLGLTILLLPYGLLVGISRIYLNVHYFSDVITGWSIGIACAAIAVMIHRRIEAR